MTFRNTNNCQSLEVVDRGSETQILEILNLIVLNFLEVNPFDANTVSV